MAAQDVETAQQPLMMEIGGRHVTLNVIVVSPPKPKAAVFLVHDLAGRADDFAPLAPMLAAAGFRVVMWDMPGRGQSAWLAAADYTTRTYATLFLALVKEHGLDQNTVLGQGWGAMLAVLYESLLKSSVKHICLIDMPDTWSYGQDRVAQLWGRLNQCVANDLAQFEELVDNCLASDGAAFKETRELAMARARSRDGKISLGIDPAIFDELQANADETYSPGAGLTRCRARVSLIQSQSFPVLEGPRVSVARTGQRTITDWRDPGLQWMVLGAIVAAT